MKTEDKFEGRDVIVCIVGLGYVGLPLAEAFSRHIQVIGYDVDDAKVAELNNDKGGIEFTTDASRIKQADFVIIAVPTPVTKSKDPDLSYVMSAARTIGQNMKKGAIVVLESTVYPGATEEVVKPILEEESGMRCGMDFKIGYSPERINPGDEEHTTESITKIVAGMDAESADRLAGLYGLITSVYRAKDIKTAEAAKVIENVQRDLNIALMNELTLIFHRMGLDTRAVLDAAGTKWNFHRYTPGLVGGHCIPVDPYYLVHKAEELGVHPQVILAGRAINDSMPGYVALMAIKGLNDVGKVIKGSKVLIMGLTYKENVPDTRESPVREIVRVLEEFGVDVYGHDPLLSDEMIEGFGVKVLGDQDGEVACAIVTVAHDEFKEMGLLDVERFMAMDEAPVLVDVRGSLGDISLAAGFGYVPRYGMEEGLSETVEWFGGME